MTCKATKKSGLCNPGTPTHPLAWTPLSEPYRKREGTCQKQTYDLEPGGNGLSLRESGHQAGRQEGGRGGYSATSLSSRWVVVFE